ncbi:MAG: hypothetical protein RL063_212 [Pseudomonadota bacterium]|jgi:hypothetical protein
MKLSFNAGACLSVFAMTMGSASMAYSASTNNILLYISPNDYKYSVHLLHPYYNFWFEQGPLLEPVALLALKAKDNEVKMCTGNETANIIIRIKPHVFYNPQMSVYHSKLEATVYSGSGQVLGSYVGKAQQYGFTVSDITLNYNLTKVYHLAMQNLMTQLKVDVVNEKPASQLPCSIIGGQEPTKINFY